MFLFYTLKSSWPPSEPATPALGTTAVNDCGVDLRCELPPFEQMKRFRPIAARWRLSVLSAAYSLLALPFLFRLPELSGARSSLGPAAVAPFVALLSPFSAPLERALERDVASRLGCCRRYVW